MAKKNKPLSPVDAGWFHMDGRTNLAMVTGVTLTREPLDFAHVKEIYTHRVATLERFRQRVVETGFPVPTPHWEDDPLFNIDDHIHHVALPEPCDQRALMDFLSDLASTPLDYKRPLWQVHIVDRVNGGSAMVLRFHHCVGDGTAMMAVAQRMFDTAPRYAAGYRGAAGAPAESRPVRPGRPARAAVRATVKRHHPGWSGPGDASQPCPGTAPTGSPERRGGHQHVVEVAGPCLPAQGQAGPGQARGLVGAGGAG